MKKLIVYTIVIALLVCAVPITAASYNLQMADRSVYLASTGKKISTDFNHISVPEEVNKIITEDEFAYAFEISASTGDEKFPEIESQSLRIKMRAPTGGNCQYYIGKDYRVFRYENGDLIPLELTSGNLSYFSFKTDRLGTFVVLFNPRVYSTTFYLDIPDEDAEDEDDSEYIYARYENLVRGESFPAPEIPKRDGYVFAGWLETTGRYLSFAHDVELKAGYCASYYYAAWRDEDTYKKPTITLSHTTIKKGAEDGKAVTIKLSGFDMPLDKECFEDSLENDFTVIGTDEVTVSNVEYLSETKLRITLSGNSTKKTYDSEYRISFPHWLVHFDSEDNLSKGNGQMGENGFLLDYYISDNTIVLTESSDTYSEPDSRDIFAILQHMANIKDLTSVQKKVFDADSNGKINLYDLNRLISRFTQN